jgi:hypothetical protein
VGEGGAERRMRGVKIACNLSKAYSPKSRIDISCYLIFKK